MQKGFKIFLISIFFISIGITAYASVTEKVDAMIKENTSNLKDRDSVLSLMVGPPVAFGVHYDQYATKQVAIGAGVGSYLSGTALDVAVKYYFLPGKFAPFVSGGGAYYYTKPNQSVFAVFVVGGLAYFFADGLGFSLGVGYVKSLNESKESFKSQWVSDKINTVYPQLGVHFTF